MIVLKSEVLDNSQRLVKFVHDNNIKREDILAVTQKDWDYTIFYYSEAETPKVKSGFFS